MRSFVLFIGKFVGLGIAGFVVGVAGALIGALLLKGELFGFGGLVGALAGMIIGYPIGVIAGIVLMTRVFHIRGSLLFGILGSTLGAVLTIGLAEPLKLNVKPNVLLSMFFLSVPLLGVAASYLKRASDKP